VANQKSFSPFFFFASSRTARCRSSKLGLGSPPEERKRLPTDPDLV